MELYNVNDMPLSGNEKLRKAQIKKINGEELDLSEKMILGRDNIIREYNGYEFKPDHVYRTINENLFNIYKREGKILGSNPNDEYLEWEEDGKIYTNNGGVDWYLGGACLRYGDIIIECPADKKYFRPAKDGGNGMAIDPTVKFMKSSGSKNPVPASMITLAIKVDKERKNMR